MRCTAGQGRAGRRVLTPVNCPGPAVVGAALAIGIPAVRSRHACLFMEEAIADRVSWRPRWLPRRWQGVLCLAM
jgi:hypothetical protein